jgi:precorrin-8X/cobalt-precorrin-8 methylmutase
MAARQRRRAARLPNGPALTAGSALPAEYSNNSMTYNYEKCGEEIYRQSFSIIRREADLKRFNPVEERVACRMIHAAGMVELAQHIHFSADFAQAAEAAPQRGAPMLCDARMVSEGITRKRLPAENPIICTLQDARVGWPQDMGNTRSAAALELWREHLDGAVVAIGNAPTALFHLLNMLEDPAARARPPSSAARSALWVPPSPRMRCANGGRFLSPLCRGVSADPPSRWLPSTRWRRRWSEERMNTAKSSAWAWAPVIRT